MTRYCRCGSPLTVVRTPERFGLVLGQDLRCDACGTEVSLPSPAWRRLLYPLAVGMSLLVAFSPDERFGRGDRVAVTLLLLGFLVAVVVYGERGRWLERIHGPTPPPEDAPYPAVGWPDMARAVAIVGSVIVLTVGAAAVREWREEQALAAEGDAWSEVESAAHARFAKLAERLGEQPPSVTAECSDAAPVVPWPTLAWIRSGAHPAATPFAPNWFLDRGTALLAGRSTPAMRDAVALQGAIDAMRSLAEAPRVAVFWPDKAMTETEVSGTLVVVEVETGRAVCGGPFGMRDLASHAISW